jgi:RimJ/RimL family protein N-acetyltransferase
MDTTRTLLRSSRVRLAAIADDDLPTIAPWWSDADFARLASDDPVLPQRVDELRDWFLSKDRWRITTGIRLNEGDTLIGFLKLTVISWPHRYADIGLGIGEPEHRGQGYGTEAMRLGVDCAFRELNMHRLQLTVFSYNTQAIRMYERLGFTHEGTLRESLRRDGTWHDTLLFGLLSRDWRGEETPA